MDHVYQLELTPDAMKLVYKAVNHYYNQWPGGEASEQEALAYLKSVFFKVVLEETFQQDA